MGLRDYKDQQGAELLQRSLQSGRVAHAYLFSGQEMGALEGVTKALAKVLNCENPLRDAGQAVDSCDACASCRKIDTDNHPDVHWVRPESKTRVILIEQIRDLMHEIQLKSGQGARKVGVIVAADRLNDKAANAFLKTLEEPPAGSVLILLTTEPQRLLETILSRCLRLTFGGAAAARLDDSTRAWIDNFSATASGTHKSLLSRYLLLDVLLKKLTAMRETIEEALTARSPLHTHPDAEKDLLEKWEDELKAAVEAEYRRQRADLLSVLQWWLRDVWLHRIGGAQELLSFQENRGAATIAKRITPEQAMANLETLEDLQYLLQNSNVQEALTLEVKLLKLHL